MDSAQMHMLFLYIKQISNRTINAIKILKQRHVIFENSRENIRG